jgi:hypothetical protein
MMARFRVGAGQAGHFLNLKMSRTKRGHGNGRSTGYPGPSSGTGQRTNLFRDCPVRPGCPGERLTVQFRACPATESKRHVVRLAGGTAAPKFSIPTTGSEKPWPKPSSNFVRTNDKWMNRQRSRRSSITDSLKAGGGSQKSGGPKVARPPRNCAKVHYSPRGCGV